MEPRRAKLTTPISPRLTIQVRASGPDGQQPMHCAAICGDLAIVQWLHARGADVEAHVEKQGPFGRAIGARVADWPRMAEARGCPGPESVTAGAAWRRIWPNRAPAWFST